MKQRRPNIVVGWIATVLILSLGAGALLYISRNPCDLPIKYSIGTVDPRFKLSENQILSVAEDAASRWNTKAVEDVLIYDPRGEVKINFVYDERQAKIDKVKNIVGELDSSGSAIETLRKNINSLISDYESDLASYNESVESWNSRGGAPPGIYEQLRQEKNSLETQRKQINSLAEILNTQIDEYNSNLANLNEAVESEKNKVITEGTYTPADKKIDIYTYGNNDELRLLMMHELGHALSLGHTSASESILYPLLGAQNLKDPLPTEEDFELFTATCKSYSGVIEIIKNKLKNINTPID